MNRKPTFAKRQREADLRDHARAKEARKAARQAVPRTTKGPEIAWDEAVYPSSDADTTATDPTDLPSVVPKDDRP